MAEDFVCWRFRVRGGRGVEEGSGGLDVDDAFAEEGETVVEALTCVVEGFVGYC